MRLLGARRTDRTLVWMLWRWLDIRPRGRDYLTRLYLLQLPWFGIRLHWFDGPDPDPDCHDHPCGFISLVLRGGYTERRQNIYAGYLLDETLTERKRWSICRRRASDIHTITSVQKGTLTLVLVGPNVRHWFFWVRWPEGTPWASHRRVPWREYLGLPADTPEV